MNSEFREVLYRILEENGPEIMEDHERFLEEAEKWADGRFDGEIRLLRGHTDQRWLDICVKAVAGDENHREEIRRQAAAYMKEHFLTAEGPAEELAGQMTAVVYSLGHGQPLPEADEPLPEARFFPEQGPVEEKPRASKKKGILIVAAVAAVAIIGGLIAFTQMSKPVPGEIGQVTFELPGPMTELTDQKEVREYWEEHTASDNTENTLEFEDYYQMRVFQGRNFDALVSASVTDYQNDEAEEFFKTFFEHANGISENNYQSIPRSDVPGRYGSFSTAGEGSLTYDIIFLHDGLCYRTQLMRNRENKELTDEELNTIIDSIGFTDKELAFDPITVSCGDVEMDLSGRYLQRESEDTDIVKDTQDCVMTDGKRTFEFEAYYLGTDSLDAKAFADGLENEMKDSDRREVDESIGTVYYTTGKLEDHNTVLSTFDHGKKTYCVGLTDITSGGNGGEMTVEDLQQITKTIREK